MIMTKNITKENHPDGSPYARPCNSTALPHHENHNKEESGVNVTGSPLPSQVVSSNKEETNVQVANANATDNDSTESFPPSPSSLNNPWIKQNPKLMHQQHQQPRPKVDFHSIMTQQEQEASEELAKLSGTTRTGHYMDDKVSEEDLIQMAIQASLKDAEEDAKEQSVVNGEHDHNMDDDDAGDDLDDDIKLAIQLSLAQANVEKTTQVVDSMSLPPMDSKLPSNDGGKDVHACDVHCTMESSQDDNNLLVTEVSQKGHVSSTTVASVPCSTSGNITREEQEEIMRAILEADDEEHAASLKLAMELQEEETRQFEIIKVEKLKNSSSRSNIRTVGMGEFEEFSACVAGGSSHGNGNAGSSRRLYSHADYDDHDRYYGREISHQEYEDQYDHETNRSTVGYTINSSMPSKAWTKIDRNTIVGPNNEIRTKHDINLKNQSNADRLLGTKSIGKLSVSDAAYNRFHQSLKNSMKRTMVKGVERSGTGRAENYAEKTRGGAMDGNVRLLISKAINNGLIQHCNGVVKEGKEAIVYHADAGSQSDGFDVAVKVFKRIEEFRNRSAYVDDDPRYHGSKFRNIDKRQQVEVWAEKEYRNLLRASRAGVAVPTPIMQKENVLFMRFLGDGGWPAAQLRELDIKKQSKKWIVLYIQTLAAIRRLYHCARLVHADLSEYNILVCPMLQVENAMDKSEESKNDLQIVLIDFGQAVERNHPSALDLLKRDLSLVNSFFEKQAVTTVPPDECLEFVLEEMEPQEDDEDEEKDDDVKDACPSMKDNQESVESKDEWRHNIKGWDDAKDMEKLERMLAEIQSRQQ